MSACRMGILPVSPACPYLAWLLASLSCRQFVAQIPPSQARLSSSFGAPSGGPILVSAALCIGACAVSLGRPTPKFLAHLEKAFVPHLNSGSTARQSPQQHSGVRQSSKLRIRARNGQTGAPAS